MDTQRIGSCLTSRSMSTKDICILMVHNDLMYHNIMLEVLENSNHHEVMRCQRTADALNRIQERKEQLSIVITDIHRSHSNGFEILNHIEKEFKLPVISMNPHQNAGAVTVRLDREAKLYIMKSLSVSEFETHWDHAYTKQRGKTNFQNVSVLQERETRTGSQIESPIHVVIQEDQKDKKRKIKEIYEQSEEDNYDIPNENKSRIMWSEAMHHKFVQVVEFLGLHRALPEKILELMNVPSLTRENVASHLQKYQICLKRAKEESKSTRSVFSINSTPLRFCQSNYSDSPSPVTKHIPYHTQESTLMSYQPRLGPFNFPDYSAEISRNTSNHGIQQFSYSSSSLFSNTQTSSWPINTNTSVPNIFSNHPETSTTTSNSSPQNLVTTNNNHVNLIFPNTQNSHLTNTTQIYSSPCTNEIPQPDSSNNIEYVGLRVTTNGELVDCDQTSAQKNTSSTDIADLLNQSNRNESLVQFPSTQMDHNSEQEYPISTFEWDAEGYFI